jgi:hypothetical protein
VTTLRGSSGSDVSRGRSVTDGLSASINDLGASHTLTATVEDQFGGGIADVEVDFVIERVVRHSTAATRPPTRT